MLKVSSLFSDGAVLCRGKEIRLFGETGTGSRVTASLTDREGRLLAEGAAEGKGGRFEIALPPQRAQTGCRLVISDGAGETAAEDIAIGEVYLAGGQSNRELELRNAEEGAEEAASTRDPLLRFFNVPRKAYESPEQQRAFDETGWRRAEPESSGYNSAAAFFFAKKLREKHPDVPVGIIGCYWGGTSVTCWMDRETLRESREGQRYLDEYAKKSGGKTMTEYLREEEIFTRDLNAWNESVAAYRTGHPGCAWREVEQACGACPWNPPAGPGSPYRPAGLVSSMLKQICPVSLTAVLFYQGEEDTGRTDRYDALLTAMIGLWRRMLQAEELPFLFVQLPMWLDFGAADTFRWPMTRLAQAKVRDTVKNTGMICLLDQGEYGNIHPTRKRPVGERLAELADAMLHGGGEVSPRAASWSVNENGVMTIKLSQPVTTRDGKAPALMEIAGSDGRFTEAEAETDGDTVRLKAAEVKRPAAARYAWTDWSDRVNVFGKNGMPLEPFWIGETDFEQNHG